MPLSDYEKIKMIGSGGFGDASLVRLKSDNCKQFVLKEMIFTTSDEYKDCLFEVDLLGRLSHPHVVAFRETFADKNVICLVMEFCGGGDMAQLIKKQTNYFEESYIIEWTLQILNALQYLHGLSRPVLHRDLKPANIFLTVKYMIKIGDFGISRELSHKRDLAQTICGTPLYLSPEIFRQEPYNHKCDIWSLGCCVYEMMTFKTAINPLLLAVANLVSINPMPSNSYNRAVISLVKKMLTEDPKARPSAEEAFRELRKLKDWNTDELNFSYVNGDSASTSEVPTAAASDANTYQSDESTVTVSYNTNDLDETLRNTLQVRAAAPVLTPEKLLKYHGYHFNEKGQFRHIVTGCPFAYNIMQNKEENEKRYQEIAQIVTEYVHDLLENNLKMIKIYLPTDVSCSEAYTFVYGTTDLFTNEKKLLVLIGGSDPVRVGVWSRKAVINDSIDAGSQIPHIKQAMQDGYAVLLLNQNQTYHEVGGVKIGVRENDTPLKHALYVWDNIIVKLTKAKNIAFITHTAGGSILAQMINEKNFNFKEFSERVFAIALCESRHNEVLKKAPKDVVDFFTKISMNWMASSHPLGHSTKNKLTIPLFKPRDQSGSKGSKRLSAGDVRVEWTAYSCKDEAFRFLEELYTNRQ